MKGGIMKKVFVFILLLIGVLNMNADRKFKELTEFERYVIEDKGTEPAYTGIYTDHFERGTYRCKRCGEELFKSDSKFHSNCGWPSFDDAIPGKVKEVPDKDGRRTEILCSNCDAHLGHVFEGEGFTNKNTRHCVNSVSLDFQPTKIEEKAYFAGGCFWGVEYLLNKQEGVIKTSVGYAGGSKVNPTYYEVAAGATRHAETVEFVFDPSIITFEELAKLFFEIHDPTQDNRQGPDIGAQYRSAIFYKNQQQKDTSEKLIRILNDKGYDVQTQLTQFVSFYDAEDYHQDYYEKKGSLPYCHKYTKRF